MTELASRVVGAATAGDRWAAAVRWIEDHAALLLILIVVMAAAIRAFAFRGYSGLDDAEYARFAYLLAHGIPYPSDYTGPAVFPLRVGVIAPTAALYVVLGVSEWTTVLYPFVVSVAGIALTYWCASLFFGAGTGLVAAALMAAFYWDIDAATRLLPDLPAAFFAALGIALAVWAVDRRHGDTRTQVLAGLAAGTAFGLSWLSKETVAYLAPFCGLLIVVTMRRDVRSSVVVWSAVAAASAMVLVGESAVYYSTTGDPLFRLREMERNYRQWANGFFSEGSDFGWAPGTTYRAALIDRLFVSGPYKILFDPTLYSLPAFGLAAAGIAWARGRREALIPGLWLLSLVLMFNFGSSSTRAYVPLALFHRYLYLEYMPAVVLVASLVWRAAAAGNRSCAGAGDRLERAFAAVAVAVIAWQAAPPLYFDVLRKVDEWNAEVRVLRTQVTPATSIYADPLTLRAFEFFKQYPAETRWVEFGDLGSARDIPAGSLVIVNRPYLEWLDRNSGMWVNWPQPGPTDLTGYRQHDFYRTPPASWRLLWATENARVYRVAQAQQSPTPLDDH